MISAAALIQAVVFLVVVGLIFWLLDYLIDVVPMAPPFKQVAKVLLVVAAVLVVISILLGLAGLPVARWG